MDRYTYNGLKKIAELSEGAKLGLGFGAVGLSLPLLLWLAHKMEGDPKVSKISDATRKKIIAALENDKKSWTGKLLKAAPYIQLKSVYKNGDEEESDPEYILTLEDSRGDELPEPLDEHTLSWYKSAPDTISWNG